MSIFKLVQSLSLGQLSSCVVVVVGALTTCFSLGSWCSDIKGERSCAELQASLVEAKGQKIELQNKVSTLEADSTLANKNQRAIVEESERLRAELQKKKEKEANGALVRRLLLTLLFLQQRASTHEAQEIEAYREEIADIAGQLEQKGEAALGFDPDSGDMIIRLGENGETLRLGRKRQGADGPKE